MSDFGSDEEIQQWIAEHSEEEFRANALSGRFAGRRLDRAKAYVRRLDEDRADALANRTVIAAEQNASAALDQAGTARKALVISKWALGISIVAIVVTVVGWFCGK